MAIFAGKFIHGAAYEFQSRVFFKPWATSIIVQCCSNLDDSSTDFPIGYTPKRSSKLNKLNDSTLSSKDSENRDVSRFTNPYSWNVELSNSGERSRIGLFPDKKSPDNDIKSDNIRSKEKKIHNSAVRSEVGEHDYKWRSADSKLMEEVHEFDAMEGPEEVLDELDFHNGKYEIKHLAFAPSKTKEEAEKTVIGLLAARPNHTARKTLWHIVNNFPNKKSTKKKSGEPKLFSFVRVKEESSILGLFPAFLEEAYTALELKKKLLGKKFSHEVVNVVISDFQDRGLINDLLYAEAFSRSRWSSSSWGSRRIKQALAKKGVNDLDAQTAIKLVLEDGEPSDDDQVSRLGLSKASMDHLFAQASKQWLRAKDLPSEKRKSRIISWLQYRGFNWGIINFILKNLQSEDPS